MIKKKWLFFIIMGLLIGVISASLFLLPGSEGSRPGEDILPSIAGGNVTVNSTAPTFRLPDPEGDLIGTEQWAGKIVLLNFWATWCAPCLDEIPFLENIYLTHSNELVVVGINAGEDSDKVNAFLEHIDISYPVLLDVERKVVTAYQIYGYPTTYFIDQEGIIRAKHVGELSPRLLEQYLLPLGINL